MEKESENLFFSSFGNKTIGRVPKKPPQRSKQNWIDPKEVFLNNLLSHSGVIRSMVKKNPDLKMILFDFLFRQKKILIIGGESGMGKSLLVADLRLLQDKMQALLPKKYQFQLVVVSWDRVHQVFFEHASTEVGTTLPLPKGETYLEARQLISKVMSDIVRQAFIYLPAKTKILIEAPLFDFRGENLREQREIYQPFVQTLIMHSPKTRAETLQAGRITQTSGQVDSMLAIREKLLKKMLGYHYNSISQEAQEEAVKNWWLNRPGDISLIEWDPDDDRTGLEKSVEEYKRENISPDILYPRPISWFTRRQFESVFQTIPSLDNFLTKIYQ